MENLLEKIQAAYTMARSNSSENRTKTVQIHRIIGGSLKLKQRKAELKAKASTRQGNRI
jgi:hypothetical protein